MCYTWKSGYYHIDRHQTPKTKGQTTAQKKVYQINKTMPRMQQTNRLLDLALVHKQECGWQRQEKIIT